MLNSVVKLLLWIIKKSSCRFGILQVKRILDPLQDHILGGNLNRAIGALLVFDLTSESSFQNVEKWLKEVKMNTSNNIIVYLVGNKKDLEAE